MNDGCDVCLAMAQWEKHLTSYRAATTNKERLRTAEVALAAAGRIIGMFEAKEVEKPKAPVVPLPARAQRRAKPLRAVRRS